MEVLAGADAAEVCFSGGFGDCFSGTGGPAFGGGVGACDCAASISVALRRGFSVGWPSTIAARGCDTLLTF